MASGDIRIDADDFRRSIRSVMTMGLPPDLADQPAFVFPGDIVNSDPADDEDVPFDSEARPTVAAPVIVRRPCAIEYVDNAGKMENFGLVVKSKVMLTLLDEDYEAIKGFSYVVIGGDRFIYTKTETPIGLDTVGVWIVHATAEDDT